MRHQLVKRDQMLSNPLVLFSAVVERKLVKILRLDKVRQTLARVHILVDLHENGLWVGHQGSRSPISILASGPSTCGSFLDVLEMRTCSPLDQLSLLLFKLLIVNKTTSASSG